MCRGQRLRPADVALADRPGEGLDVVAQSIGQDLHGVPARLYWPTAERGGRSRRYFSVEPHALELLRGHRDALLAMWDGLEPRVP